MSAVIRRHPAACTLRLVGGSDLTGAVVLDGPGSTVTLTTSESVIWTVPMESVIAIAGD
jgi:hypothetical protein